MINEKASLVDAFFYVPDPLIFTSEFIGNIYQTYFAARL